MYDLLFYFALYSNFTENGRCPGSLTLRSLRAYDQGGNKEAREGTARFLLRHRSERSHFNIFEHCVRCYARVVHRVLSASCVVSMQRRIYRLGAPISVPCATDRSIGLPELRHCKCHFQTDPDVKFRKPDCCCPAPDGRKHVELRKTASGRQRRFAFRGLIWLVCSSLGEPIDMDSQIFSSN